MLSNAKAMGGNSDDDGKYIWKQALRIEDIVKMKGCKRKCIEDDSEIRRCFLKSQQKRNWKVSVPYGLFAKS